jgi:hypothetical protein
MEPYDVAWENRTEFLGIITDDDPAMERLSNVRISSESFSLIKFDERENKVR